MYPVALRKNRAYFLSLRGKKKMRARQKHSPFLVRRVFFLCALLMAAGSFFLYAQEGVIRFRIVAVNPSSVKTQTVPVKVFLPQEVKPENIIELGNLNLEYDSQESLFYVYTNNLVLKPNETRIYEVEVQDIWNIPLDEFTVIRSRIDKLSKKLKGSAYEERINQLAKDAEALIKEIGSSQKDDTISRSQHIGVYRINSRSFAQLKEEVDEAEKLLEVKTGPLTPDIFDKSNFATRAPTKTATWLVIFAVIVFIALLSLVFFFTWHKQSKVTDEVISRARESSFGKEE